MSDREDRSYFLRRAQDERAVASRSEDRSIKLLHLRLADEYERRAALLSRQSESAISIASPRQ
jgi:hypothetical protein